jgi:SAM-dependent methyltransferase
MGALTAGNSAKLYCLNWIETYAQQKEGKISILDLGCGTALNLVTLLRQYPGISYVGLEPLKSAALAAERNLKGLNATIVHAYGYSAHERLGQEFDIVMSFSVLEHVYRRIDYLRSAKACLKSDGYFLINYDAGHFVLGTRKDRLKNLVGPVLARLGIERYYQSFVREQDFQSMVKALGLKIIDDKFFNTGLKGVYKVVPGAHQTAYMEKWLSFELWLNELGIVYDDSRARAFVTRNFILQR